ncbi:hypothetical protein ACFE04_027447 [Oxalis oulophora]
MASLPRFTTHSPFPVKKSVFFKTSSALTVSVLKTASRPLSELAEEDILQTFFKDRALNGDIISKASDALWQREVLKAIDIDADNFTDNLKQEEPAVGSESDADGGFLKLSSTQEWILGDITAPINKQAIAKEMRDNSDKRRKLNILQYEAIKRELMLLSVGIGGVCTGYCLVVFSVQAALSYAVGVLFSLLYLQLLYRHSDNLSKEMVPDIFMKKKQKKIGIRSEDLQDALEKTFKGSVFVLSSPRLVIPAAIYGLWALSHQYFSTDFFDFQIVPAMFGLFVYKAAALVQYIFMQVAPLNAGQYRIAQALGFCTCRVEEFEHKNTVVA